MTKPMTKSIITFPAADKQTCYNCKTTLGIEKLYANFIEMTKDAYGMPALIVRCPVCMTPIEWETKGN
jgi:hypothetical protein